jgi:hypothetical protein
MLTPDDFGAERFPQGEEAGATHQVLKIGAG